MWFGRVPKVIVWTGLIGGAVCVVGQQRTQPTPVPTPMPDYGRQIGGGQTRQPPFEDQALHELEEKRGKALNNERQRLMIREADQLVQTAADLQMRVAGDPHGAERDEAYKRAELMEKLARNVKERMRGSR